MCSGVGDWTCLQPGFPIRKSSNHSSVASSSRLIAGSYVLHRLLVPRHPPCALSNLTTDTKDARVHCAVLKLRAGLPSSVPAPARSCGRFIRRSAPYLQPQVPGGGANARSLRTQQRARPARSVQMFRSGVAPEVLAGRPRAHQLVDVPPMSNHPEAFVRVVALDAVRTAPDAP